MSLGERITELRKISGISQNQLAKDMGVSRQAVSKWENGQSTPDPIKIIHLAQILDTDVEYLSTGRRNYGRRPPVVINTVETVEKIVEKPVVQVVEKVVEKVIEQPVVQIIEKPVIKKVYRTKYYNNLSVLFITGIFCFVIGLLIGIVL